MTHDGEKFSLHAIGGVGSLLCRARVLFGSATLGDRGAHDEKRGRDDRHERLKGQKALVQRGMRERAVSQRRSPDGDDRDRDRRGHRSALSETQRCPDEHRKEHVRLSKRIGAECGQPYTLCAFRLVAMVLPCG